MYRRRDIDSSRFRPLVWVSVFVKDSNKEFRTHIHVLASSNDAIFSWMWRESTVGNVSSELSIRVPLQEEGRHRFLVVRRMCNTVEFVVIGWRYFTIFGRCWRFKFSSSEAFIGVPCTSHVVVRSLWIHPPRRSALLNTSTYRSTGGNPGNRLGSSSDGSTLKIPSGGRSKHTICRPGCRILTRKDSR